MKRGILDGSIHNGAGSTKKQKKKMNKTTRKKKGNKGRASK
jgi:hypothetical protein